MADAAPERNLKLTLEYDGRAYVGWQFQDNGPSIQLRLMAAIERMTGERAVISVAGRTDAGVHAVGQVANFHTRSQIETRRFIPGLNSLLPRDISVHSVVEVPEAFDARHDSLSKRYRYRIYVSRHRAALEEGRAWLVPAPLDVGAMRSAAVSLVGEHDFNAFRSSECDALHARKRHLRERCPGLAIVL